MVIEIDEIPDRVTMRLNTKDKIKLVEISKRLAENEISKLIKFGIDWTDQNLKNVTESIAPPDYEIYLQRKRKTQPGKRMFI